VSDEPLEHYLIDMDGVLVHEENALPGAGDFIRRLGEAGKQFLVLTSTTSAPAAARSSSARPG
jgi:NagD protein